MHVEYVERDASGYRVGATVIDPADAPELESAGYSKPMALYLVFTGGEVFADHDPHRLVRESFAGDRWLIDELEDVGRRVFEDAGLE